MKAANNTQFIGLLFSLAILAGCTLKPAATHQTERYYDIGIPDTDGACALQARLGNVTAIPALQGSRMWYRNDQEPFEPQPFAISRWSAAPSTLLRRHLQPLFSILPEHPALDVEIIAMELEINPESNAKVVVMLRANLLNHENQNEQQFFKIEQSAEASPAGAAASTALAFESFNTALCQWLALIKPTQG